MNNKQLNWDKKFLEICGLMAQMSKCQSRQVCAIATKNNRIIATGINGSLSGFQNCNEVFPFGVNEHNREEHHIWSLENEAHAEDNLIAEFSKNSISCLNSTVYVNLQPCKICTLRLANIGIKRIVYSNTYDKASTTYTNNTFSKCNIITNYIPL